METLDDIVEEVMDVVEKYGVACLYRLLVHTEVNLIWTIDNESSSDGQPLMDWTGYLVVRGALTLISKILENLNDEGLSEFVSGVSGQQMPDSLFGPLQTSLLSARVVSVCHPLVDKVSVRKNPLLGQPVVSIEWKDTTEDEYLSYLKGTAIDDEHYKWFVKSISEVTSDSCFQEELDKEFVKLYEITAHDLFSCLKLIEKLVDLYWNEPEKLINLKGEDIPLWRFSVYSLKNKLRKKLAPEATDKVIELLTWRKGLDMFKHPIIPDNKGNYLLAVWYWSLTPNPPQSWMYPYYHCCHNLSGMAGEIRGKQFEKYLQEKIREIFPNSSIIMNREYESSGYPSVAEVGLEKIEIDLAVRIGDIGLIVDAKGGVVELPKRLEDILWNSISSDDVYHRFVDENKVHAEKWDKVIQAVRNSEEIQTDLHVNGYSELIPIIVHSKIQPAMIEGYRIKYGYPYETKFYSIATLLELLKSYTS